MVEHIRFRTSGAYLGTLKVHLELAAMPRTKTKTEPSETIAQRISRLRVEAGYTQEELAQQLGMTQSLVSAYERGTRRLYVDLIIQMAEVFGVTPNELLGVDNGGRGVKPMAVHLVKRMNKIQELPKHRQKMLLGTIDYFLKGAGIEIDDEV